MAPFHAAAKKIAQSLSQSLCLGPTLLCILKLLEHPMSVCVWRNITPILTSCPVSFLSAFLSSEGELRYLVDGAAAAAAGPIAEVRQAWKLNYLPSSSHFRSPNKINYFLLVRRAIPGTTMGFVRLSAPPSLWHFQPVVQKKGQIRLSIPFPVLLLTLVHVSRQRERDSI